MHQSTPGAFEKNGKWFKRIEDIHAKDIVLSWNEKKEKFEYKPVVQTFIRQTDKIYRITYEDGTKVETTWSHPFYIENKGWVKAADLMIGDKSKTEDTDLGIASVDVDRRTEEVYNFEVGDNHTYLVMVLGAVVHNDCLLIGDDLEKAMLLENLQKLTDDELAIVKDQYGMVRVIIKEKRDGSKPKGTELVRGIVEDDEHKVYIATGDGGYASSNSEDSLLGTDLPKEGSFTLENPFARDAHGYPKGWKLPDGTPGPGTDSFIYLDQTDVNTKFRVYSAQTNSVMERTTPLFLSLGHELVHADMNRQGMGMSSYRKAVEIKRPIGPLDLQPDVHQWHLETLKELFASGIPAYSTVQYIKADGTIVMELESIEEPYEGINANDLWREAGLDYFRIQYWNKK